MKEQSLISNGIFTEKENRLALSVVMRITSSIVLSWMERGGGAFVE
jgi:hypothetical protein